MAAQVFAAAAGFRVSRDLESSFRHQQVRVLAQRRQAAAVRRDEVQAFERDRAPRTARRVRGALLRCVLIGAAPQVRRRAVPPRLARANFAIGKLRNEFLQCRLELASENRIHAQVAQVGFVHRSVQAVKAEMRARIQAPHGFDQGYRQARGRVHRNIECHDVRCANGVFMETLARQIQADDFRAARGAAMRPETPAQRADGRVRTSR